ncbi:MAG: YesL family protein [Clostridiaceae bacterium]|nr:YesL family protein [Clostridiaceae bacterium]
MAGFFGLFDYTKEGPGVPKDAPPKSRFRIFFDVLARKFWNIVKVNLLFGIFNIPAIVFLALFAGYLQLLLTQNIGLDPEEMVNSLFFGTIPLMTIFVCLPLITVGPAQAGMTYILRNYSREEHAFIWGDFKEHALKNFKQSMIVSIINTICTVLVILDIYFYLNFRTDNLLITAASAFIIIAFVIFMMMSMYIYPMMVTFDLTIKQLYKNAFLFAIMKFFPNLLILIIIFVLLFFSFYYPVIGYLLFIFITMGLISYITNFYVYSKIDRYMIQPIKEADNDNNNDETDSVFSDSRVFEEENSED